MAGLIERDGRGNWHVKGLPWEYLQEGQPVTHEVWEKLYGCLYKLMQYEKTGLTLGQVDEMQDMNYCVPEYKEEIFPFGIQIAKCTCGAFATADQNFCDRCGIRLLWRRKEGGTVGTEKGKE
ncbi:MAG: hypothetical protein NC489_32630 [Ruminococcus flavefaciens]|nr:hypothetical protein [Ruminococcus flavefaciens]